MERDRAAYRDQMETLARDAFLQHGGASKAAGAKGRGIDGAALGWHGGRVCIKRPGTSIYAVEVVWLRFSRMLVHGDISPVVIACPGDDFRSAVHRLANSNVDYVADKVSEGSRQSDGGWTRDRDVFYADLYRARRGCFDGEGVRQVPAEMVDAYDQGIEDVGYGASLDHVLHVLHAGGVDSEGLDMFGRVVAVPVWYAHAALKMLDHLHGWRCVECEGSGGYFASSRCAVCDGRGMVDERPAVPT